MQYEIEDADVGFEGYVTKIRFPKKKEDYNGWCAFDFQVDSVFIGEIRKNTIKNGIIPLCGYAPLAKENIRYRVYAKYEMSPKYGHTYQVCYMSSIVSLKTEEDVRNFLLTILPQKTVENFMEYTKDPIGLIKSGDISEMCNIKGVGFTRAQDIVAKFRGVDDRAEVYAIFTKLGLTKRLADDLIEQYKSADSLMADINKNPYILIEKCDGVGWAKADNLALKMGIAEDSEFRIKAYVNYFLTKIAETEGHTWVTLQNLLSSVLGLSKVITKDRVKTILRELVDKEQLHYEEQTKRIGLNKYYRLEKRICDELVRLRDAEVFPVKHIDETIADCEKTVGFEYTQEQKDAIYKIFKNNVFLLTANAGCVDKDTEFFNGEKWKKISEYKSGERVLQYNEDGSASLTKPLMYFKKPCDKLYHFETKYGINQTVCEEHDVLYWKSENIHDSCKVKDIKDKQELYRSGFSGKIKAGFNYSGNGINLSDEEIRVMCAVICDGSFDSSVELKTNSHSYRYCRFHIKKDRKKERIRKLFSDAKIEFKEHNSIMKGYTDFYIKAPMRTKMFDEFWYHCTNKQLQVICDEILYWDGSITKTKNNKEKKKFSTTLKENADFVQFAFTACGYRATIKVDDRKGKKYFTAGKQYVRKSICYEVFISDNVFVGFGNDSRICHKKTKVEEVKSEDGYKYCFMVESTMLVLRRNNCIFVTHNCGKTTIMYPVARILRRNGYNFASCALSGKASLNLSETIGEEGKTIHRLLEFNGFTTQFDRDVNNPLEQNVVILDEVSMVGGDLFLHLLRAMKTGTKLIMIGDPGQLESIGLCNLISDIKGSGKIAQAYLTKIFRQAQKSGIITDSLKVYHQEQILPSNGFVGNEVHGELKDFEIISKNTTQDCLNEIVKKFKKFYYEDKIPIDDIIIAVAKRAIGPLSARCVNQIIQNLLELPKERTLTHKYNDQVLYEITFHVGDKVLVTKNNYKAETIEGINYPIFNGNIGTVYDICGDTLLMKIDDKIMLYGPGEIGDLQLGYAVTTHKLQGTGYPYVIAVCDQGSFNLLSKEHLYTEITRAKKYCALIGTPKAITTAIKTTRVVKKQTYLGEMLAAT